jgi:hypothetical protein
MATPSKVTLLDLVQAVNNYATNDDEIVATVASLVNSGKVLLCGNFAGARINIFVPAGTAHMPTLESQLMQEKVRKYSQQLHQTETDVPAYLD